MISTGTFQRTLDSKLRVMLPKLLRNRLVSADELDHVEKNDDETLEPDSNGIELFLTPGTDSCLELHTAKSLHELAVQVKQNRPSTQNLRSFLRLFYARAHALEVDGQGRIRIPRPLAELADLEKEIVFVGVGFHFELWDQGRWHTYLDQHNDQFDSIVETTLDAGSVSDSLGRDNESNNVDNTLGRAPK
ncbi:MAG: hypothetical protein AAFN77_02040 [Planctomycetota bacterium]